MGGAMASAPRPNNGSKQKQQSETFDIDKMLDRLAVNNEDKDNNKSKANVQATVVIDRPQRPEIEIFPAPGTPGWPIPDKPEDIPPVLTPEEIEEQQRQMAERMERERIAREKAEAEARARMRHRPTAKAAAPASPLPPPFDGSGLVKTTMPYGEFERLVDMAEKRGHMLVSIPVRTETGRLVDGDPNIDNTCITKIGVDLAEAMTRETPESCPIRHPMVVTRGKSSSGKEMASIVFSPLEVSKITNEYKQAYYDSMKGTGAPKRVVQDGRIDVSTYKSLTCNGYNVVNDKSVLDGVCKIIGMNHLLSNGNDIASSLEHGRPGRSFDFENNRDKIFKDMDAMSSTYCNFVKDWLKKAVTDGCEGIEIANGSGVVKNTAFPPLSEYGVKLDDTKGDVIMAVPYDKEEYIANRGDHTVNGISLGRALVNMANAVNAAWKKEVAFDKDFLLTDLQKHMAQELRFGTELKSVYGKDGIKPDVMQITCGIRGDMSPYCELYAKAAKVCSEDPKYAFFDNNTGERLNKVDVFGEEIINGATAIYEHGDNDSPSPSGPSVAIAAIEREAMAEKLIELANRDEPQMGHGGIT